MKARAKLFVAAAAIAAIPVWVAAGTQMVVHTAGGERTYEVSAIQRITFQLHLAAPGDPGRLRQLAQAFCLLGNHPNPFNASTTIRYELAEPGLVDLKVFDLQGREVAVLMQGRQEAGVHSLQWDGRSTSGERAASGAYLSRLVVNGTVQTQQMLMLR